MWDVMRTYAYYKKRTDDKEWLMKQIKLLSRLEVDEVIMEETGEYQEYFQLMGKLKKLDTLIIYKFSVLELKKIEMKNFITTLKSLEIRLIIVADKIDTNEVDQVNFIANCLVFIQSESETIKYLTKRSLEEAHRNGIVLGRPQIATDTVEAIRYYREEQKMSIRRIAEECEVSIGTVHKYISSPSPKAIEIVGEEDELHDK